MTVYMHTSSGAGESHWQTYLSLLRDRFPLSPFTHPHYVRWTSNWRDAGGETSPEATRAFFDDLGRGPGIEGWQFRQAVDAVRLWVDGVARIPWSKSFDWVGLSEESMELPSSHRSLLRDTLNVPSRGHRLSPPARASRDRQPTPGEDEVLRQILEELRREVRLAGLAPATEKTYAGWTRRFTRFCLWRLGISPKEAGPPAISAYLEYLALERRVSPRTQKLALNAMVFLTRRVHQVEEFDLEVIPARNGPRRPPVVLSRKEVREVFGRLQDPWRLIAELLYGSGLRQIEGLRLRVKDPGFDRGVITVHDGKGGKHRLVPLPQALEGRLRRHLEVCRERHQRDLAAGVGETHLPESLRRKYPNAARQWCWHTSSPPPKSASIPAPAVWLSTTCTRNPCSVNSSGP